MSAVAFPTYPSPAYRLQSLPARPQSTRLVLTRRGRRVISTLVALPLAIAAFIFALSAGDAAATNTSSSVSTSLTWITVEPGETLWSLAEEIAPTKDPRDVIAEIVSLNQLHSDIQPGQRIALPAGF